MSDPATTLSEWSVDTGEPLLPELEHAAPTRVAPRRVAAARRDPFFIDLAFRENGGGMQFGKQKLKRINYLNEMPHRPFWSKSKGRDRINLNRFKILTHHGARDAAAKSPAEASRRSGR